MQEYISKNIAPRCSSDILRMTWAEKEEVCKEWQRSGLNKKTFCLQKNINISTFAGWCAKLWPQIPKTSDNLLYPVNITGNKPYAPIAEPIVLEVSFPNAIIAKVQATIDQFSYLLREIIDATAVIR